MSVGRITPVKKRAVREADGTIRILEDGEQPGDFKGSFREPPRRAHNAFKNPGHHLEDRVQKILTWEGFSRVEINRLVRDGDGNLSELDVVGWGGRYFSRWLPRSWSPLKFGQGSVFVECKRYSQGNPVSLADAAKFKEVGVLNNLPRRNMLMVTTSSYVPRARKIGISTVDGAALAKWERAAWRRFRQRRVRRAVIGAVVGAAALTVTWGASKARELRTKRCDSAPSRDASLFSRKVWEMTGTSAPAQRRAFLMSSSNTNASAVTSTSGSSQSSSSSSRSTSTWPGLGVVVTLHSATAAARAAADAASASATALETAAAAAGAAAATNSKALANNNSSGASKTASGASADSVAAVNTSFSDTMLTNPFESLWSVPVRALKQTELGKSISSVLEPSLADEEQRRRRKTTGELSFADRAGDVARVGWSGAKRAASWLRRPAGGFRTWFWARNDAVEIVWMPAGCALSHPHATVGPACASWFPEQGETPTHTAAGRNQSGGAAQHESEVVRPVRLFRIPVPHFLSVPKVGAFVPQSSR